MIFHCRFIDGSVDTFQIKDGVTKGLEHCMDFALIVMADKGVYSGMNAELPFRVTLSKVFINFKHVIWAYEL